VTSIEDMAKRRRSAGKVARWKGDAVERRPDREAEEAATRAEGNGQVSAADESARLAKGDIGSQPHARPHRPTRDEGAEEDVAEIAEEHQARDAIERPPRGKL
jgi:hypothetical protein